MAEMTMCWVCVGSQVSGGKPCVRCDGKGEIEIDPAAIEKAMAEIGFVKVGTGGGCEAFERIEADGSTRLITDEDAGVPQAWDEHVTVGLWSAPAEYVDSEFWGETCAEVVATMRDYLAKHGTLAKKMGA